jgi:hypothetical protein
MRRTPIVQQLALRCEKWATFSVTGKDLALPESQNFLNANAFQVD